MQIAKHLFRVVHTSFTSRYIYTCPRKAFDAFVSSLSPRFIKNYQVLMWRFCFAKACFMSVTYIIYLPLGIRKEENAVSDGKESANSGKEHVHLFCFVQISSFNNTVLHSQCKAITVIFCLPDLEVLRWMEMLDLYEPSKINKISIYFGSYIECSYYSCDHCIMICCTLKKTLMRDTDYNF